LETCCLRESRSFEFSPEHGRSCAEINSGEGTMQIVERQNPDRWTRKKMRAESGKPFGSRGIDANCFRNWIGSLALIAVPHLPGQTGWNMAPPLPSPMGEIVGAVVAGKWYVMAGLDAKTGKAMGSVSVFDPSSNTWTAKKTMPVPADHINIAELNGKIYAFGGFVSPADITAWQPTNRSWVYTPSTDVWQKLTAMPTPRGAGAAVELNGRVYVIGGAQANIRGNPAAPFTPGTPQLVLRTVEEYDPATNQWRVRTQSPLSYIEARFYRNRTGRTHALVIQSQAGNESIIRKIVSCESWY
jgi:hypothetical protein